jgi:hypothetical protein
MFNQGVQFIHHMTWSDPALDAVGRQTYRALAAENVPRPGVTGGIGSVCAVYQTAANGYPVQQYDIVQIGTGSGHAGLLKSIRQDGSWQGTVYVQPFHAAVVVSALHQYVNLTLTSTGFQSNNITGLNSGDQIEISFLARNSSPNGKMTLLALHNGIELVGKRRVIAVGPDWSSYRYTLRIQIPLEGLIILINSGERDTPTGFQQTLEMRDFLMLVHKEQIARKEFGINNGTPHRGGISFDVLSREMVPEQTMDSPFPPEVEKISAWKLY